MSRSDRVKGLFLDRSRNKMCAALRRMGIDAHLAELGRFEEKIDGVFMGVSRGIIDISEGPIRWVNVVLMFDLFETMVDKYFIKCGVPDPKIGHDFPNVRIKSVPKRSFPLFGSVVDLHWEGNDFGLGIISRLNSDTSLKRPLMESHDVTIRAYYRYFREYREKPREKARENAQITAHDRFKEKYLKEYEEYKQLISTWVISIKSIKINKGEIPSERLWSCYQRIAQHLLGVEHKQLKEIPEIPPRELTKEEIDEIHEAAERARRRHEVF